MNEQHPNAERIDSTSAPYKDRSTGLLVFGVLTILLGCLMGLFVPLMLLGQTMAAASPQGSVGLSALAPAFIMYGGLSVALIWLGIGSVLARRWARALLLIFSWSWLGMGVFIIAITAFLMPKMMANLPSTMPKDHPPVNMDAVVGGVLIFMLLFDGFLFVVLPAIWTFFYHSRHVKATCQARDPIPDWTDACPLPVLGLCVWLVFSLVMMLAAPISGHGVMPFFGMFLTGLPVAIFYVVIAILLGGTAWLLYRLDRRGWWLMVILVCVSTVSNIMTFARHDMLDMYRLMDYPPAQIEQIQKSGLLMGNSMMWMMSLWVVPVLGYLFFIKRYFRQNT